MNQVIITGLPITVEQATDVRKWLIDHNAFATEWCHPDGVIGYIDASLKNLTQKNFKNELEAIAKTFPYLTVGFSWMSGPPGAYNIPLAGYLIESGTVIRTMLPHTGHGPPKRYKNC